MALEDLFQAMNMFKEGAQQLGLSRAIGAANDQVQQIRASEASEQEKRTQLQQLSNGLVAHMAQIGTPATTMQAVTGALGPKQYANSNQMNMDATLTGNKELGDMAQQQQDFENDPKYELAKLKAQQKLFNQSPLGLMKLQEQQAEFDSRSVRDFNKSLDPSQAVSRSAFGQWAGVENRGQRLDAILGDPQKWKSMTPQELGLVTEGLVQMSKGGVATKEESEGLKAASLQLKAAMAASAVTGKPAQIDLSPYAKLYSSVVQREGIAAKSGMLDAILSRTAGGAKLFQSDRTSDDAKLAVAKNLAQIGVYADPKNMTWEKGKGLVIPELQPKLDAIDKAPTLVRQMLVGAKQGDPEALQALKQWGLTADMSPADAIKRVQTHIKSKIWE